jgi:protein arginine N-methyltransferase 5
MPAVIAPFYTSDDIARASIIPAPAAGPSPAASAVDSPVLTLVAQAAARGYESVALPLTTEPWKDRWHGMCVLSGAGEGEDRELDQENARRAEVWRTAPTFTRDEVTVTRLGTIYIEISVSNHQR